MLETLAAREGRASCLSLCRFWFCLLALCLGPLGGCARSERAAEGERTNIDVSDEGVGEEVFSYVFDLLQQYPRIEAADAPVQALEQLNQWISSERRRSKWRRDPLVDELLRRRPELARLVPSFESLRLVRGWAGLYETNTLDHNGLIGPWPELNGFYLINGFSGHGVQQAPAAGRHLAELIIGKKPSLDLSRLSPLRVLENKPLPEIGVV